MKIHKLIKSTTVAEKADLLANFIITILTRTGLHSYLHIFSGSVIFPYNFVHVYTQAVAYTTNLELG